MIFHSYVKHRMVYNCSSTTTAPKRGQQGLYQKHRRSQGQSPERPERTLHLTPVAARHNFGKDEKMDSYPRK